MSRSLHQRWARLEKILRQNPRWLIAYSGGADSAFLIAAARRTLGAPAVLAMTAVSPSLATAEKDAAEGLARVLDVPHRFLATHELENPSYQANPSNRCFFCKDELYSRLAPIAEGEQRVLADGFNASDRQDVRPGAVAAKKWDVRHPLDEADLTKRDVRTLSRWLKLPTWNKPASPCLSSRLPYGTPVTRTALRQVEAAESILHAEGFREVRVRHYGATARIEVPLKHLPPLQEKARWQSVVQRIRAVGYNDVVLDARGFRGGRLNETPARSRDGKK